MPVTSQRAGKHLPHARGFDCGVPRLPQPRGADSELYSPRLIAHVQADATMSNNHRLSAALFLALASSAPAAADGLRDLCTDRPGLGTPPCIVDRGHLIVETGIADWTHTSDP